MTLEFFKVILALIVLLMALIGGIWPFFKKKMNSAKDHEEKEIEFPIGESLASGIFFGAGLLHMLPDAAQGFYQAGYGYPLAFLIAGLSFILLLFLEHISVFLQHRSRHISSSVTLLSVIMLSIHSLLEGAAVGFSTNLLTSLVIFMAILAHKGAASFALSINLNRSAFPFSIRIFAFSFFALMTPVGILAADWMLQSFHTGTLLSSIFSALAAGTFVYIGTLHGLQRASLIKHCCNMREFFWMLAGFSLMAIVAIWV